MHVRVLVGLILLKDARLANILLAFHSAIGILISLFFMFFVKPLSPAVDSIVSTLAFFALFSRPLQGEEIVRYAYVSGSVVTEEELREQLTHTSRYWYQEKGYYYLTAAKYVRSIHDVQQVTNDFLCKAKRYLPLLRHVPYVRFVGVVNTVAFGSATLDSDIDLFIVTKKNKIWLTRLLVTLLLHILGVRRHGKKVRGRFCLSFYVDEVALDLTDIALQPKDVYLEFWLRTLIPVWENETYKAFIHENKTTLLTHFPFWMKREPLFLFSPSKLQTMLERLIPFPLFSWIGEGLVQLQKNKMKRFPVPQNEFSSVIISEHMLKFHNNDRRSRYQKEWEKLIISVISQT